MLTNKVAGKFDHLENAQKLIGELTQRSFHIPASDISVSTDIIGRYEYADQKYLLRLFSAWIALGSLVGFGYGVQFFHPDGIGTTLVAAMAFGVVGAALGQLMAGLSDVVFNGSLDDRLDLDEPVVYTVSAAVPSELEPTVENAMIEKGATEIVSLK